MNDFNDTIAEEKEKKHEEIIAMCMQVSHQFHQQNAAVEKEAIQRVGEKLAMFEKNTVQARKRQIIPERNENALRSNNVIRLKFHPGKQKGYYINTLAVILVATFVIAASMMLFKNQFVSTAGNGSSVPVTAQVSVAGLEMSMNVTPGPYFLSELVFVHMSLTNHSHTTFLLEGLQTTTPCGPALYLDQSGGANPRYTLPLNEDSVFVSCPHISSSELKTGQSITIQQYEPLTSSGHVMLSAKATFLKLEGGRNIHSSSPLDGHWPSLQLQVASHIPASRLLSLHVHDQQIRIDAPASVQPLYRFTETCDGMSLANGTPAWEPVSTHSLNVTNYMAGCSANHTRWQYAISAVGYAIVAQKYPL